MWRGSCPLLDGAQLVPDDDATQCAAFKKQVFEQLRDSPEIKTVFLAGRWPFVFTGRRTEMGGAFRLFLTDRATTSRSDVETKMVFARSLSRTIKKLNAMGKQVIVLGSIPDIGYDVPTFAALKSHNDRHNAQEIDVLDFQLSEFRERGGNVDGLIASIAVRNNVVFIPITNALCETKCAVTRNGRPLYSDDDHLTQTASRTILGSYIHSALR